jgi:hypothetical protein
MSSRYALPAALLLLVSLLPTVVHSYLGVRRDDGIRAGQVMDGIDAQGQVGGVRSEAWARQKLGPVDWAERLYVSRAGREARLSVVRGFDAKVLYHHPELALSYDVSLPEKSVIELAGLPGVPVHALRGNVVGPPQMVLYALHYGDQFVEDPLFFQFRLTAELLVGGRRPMTLFFVLGDDAGSDSPGESAAAEVLREAVQSFTALRQRPPA